MREPESITVNDDARMIPVWSIVAASLAFVLVEYYFWWIAPAQHHHPPRRSACASTSISPGESWPRSTSSWSATSAKMRRGAA